MHHHSACVRSCHVHGFSLRRRSCWPDAQQGAAPLLAEAADGATSW